MAKTTVLATGLNGLVGSKLKSDFSDQYNFDNLDLRDEKRPVDITNYDQLASVISASSANYLIHFAAYTNVNGAWEQRNDKSGLCYQVNVGGTKNVLKACKANSKHLIHISTAYVFDGKKEGLYTEEDQMSPIEWYGQTKAWAEEEILNSEGLDWTILRIDQPFRSDSFEKADTLHRIINGVREGKLYPQFADHYFGPTFVDDFAKIIDSVMRLKLKGLYHASSGEQWSDYDFAKTIIEELKLDFDLKKGSLAKYLETSQRPYQKNTAMATNKLREKLDFKPLTIRQAIAATKRDNLQSF